MGCSCRRCLFKGSPSRGVLARNHCERLDFALSHPYSARMPLGRKSLCPASDCLAANPTQTKVGERLIEQGVQGDWVKNAWRCNYCGCVYTTSGDAKVIRGHLDKEVLGKGWKPL
jgi:hypothetical protein